jgi:hypothetical protein
VAETCVEEKIPSHAEAWVRSRVSPCGICRGQSGTGTGFFPSTSVLPCQFYSTGAPLLGKMKTRNWSSFSHLHHRVEQEVLRLRCVRIFCCGALLHKKNPSQGEEELICPTYKKGRPLTMWKLSWCIIGKRIVAYKVFSKMLFQRAQPYTEERFGDWQCRYRNKKSAYQLCSMRQILERWENTWLTHSV